MDQSCTGIITLHRETQEELNSNTHTKPLVKPIDDLNIYFNEGGGLVIPGHGCGAKMVLTSPHNWSFTKTYSVAYSDGEHLVDLGWSRSNFADFCISLLSRLEGIPYNSEKRPSFGLVFDYAETRKAPLQPIIPKIGRPFLDVEIFADTSKGDKTELVFDGKKHMVQLSAKIHNSGTATATISDDGFKTTVELSPQRTVIKTIIFQIEQTSKKAKKRSNIINEEFKYRVVYFTEKEDNKDYLVKEVEITIKNNKLIY